MAPPWLSTDNAVVSSRVVRDELRGAVYRVDVGFLVGLLKERDWPGDALQLMGRPPPGVPMRSSRQRVLISGASVAGPVTAYWLSRFGFQPTVVERTAEHRVGGGGHAVDLFGPSIEIMSWMGALDQVQAARTQTEIVTLIRPGKRPVDIDAARLAEGVSDSHVEVMRGDLAQIAYDLSRDEVEYVFGDSISSLTDTGSEVEVTFEHGPPRTFDLVIGADGLHSLTRRLTFGDEHQFLHFLGGYLAVFSLPNYLGLEGRMLASSGVDRAVALYPVRQVGQARALFLLRSREQLAGDNRDPAGQQRRLRALFSDLGWEVPRLLDEMQKADDLYVDSISQIQMNTWSRGRVTLVGDAGYSPGPAVGGGTSLAVVGGYVLATELAAAVGDHEAGFAAYERALAGAVRHSRSIGPAVLATLIPRSATQVWVMAQAMRLLPRLPGPIRRKMTSFGGGPAAMLNSVTLRDYQTLPSH